MIAASLLEFAVVLRLVLGADTIRRRWGSVVVVSVVVVVLGMSFGRYGALVGLPWWLYYPVPALVTVLLPPVVFRMRPARTAGYLLLALLSAPLIHAVFAFFLGWDEYLPFLPIPSLAELLG
jgi:hypothetical protein